MSSVVITGWEKGFQKIGMTKLICRHMGYDLARGKHCVDDILEGKVVTLTLLSSDELGCFVGDARKIGAVCHVVGTRSALAA